MKFELKKTADGSNTFFIPELDEFFHSPKGALSESEYVFIEKGLMSLFDIYPNKNNINILEVGFGTGLNAILSYLRSLNGLNEIYYHSIDKFPLSLEELKLIDHKSLFPDHNIELILNAEWNKIIDISNNFKLFKDQTDLFDLDVDKKFDLIYYDAFAPSKQSEMWGLDALRIVTEHANDEAILVTYCAQGQFKRNLKELGWTLEKLPGANHKREMVRAKR